MKKKRVAAGLTVMALACTTLFGCGGSGTSPADVGSDEGGVSGTLVIWDHGGSFETAGELLIEKFQEAYPEVEVEFENKTGDTYYSLLTTAVQSGEGPDIFWTNGTATTNLKNFVDNDAVMDLTDIVDYSELVEESLALGRIDGKMYTVPWMAFDTRCCYYNKDIFEKEGFTVPETFSEFEELLKKQSDAGYTPISFCPNNSWPILFAFEPLLQAMHPDYTSGLADYSVKATDPAAADTLNKMLEWKDKGYFGANAMGVIGTSEQTLAFTTEKAVMNIAGSWDISTIMNNNPDLNFGAFLIPAEDGSRGMVGTYSNGYSVNADTKNLEAAKAFVRFCATNEAQTLWVQAMEGPSGSPNIEPSNEIAKQISGGDATYTSWQSVLANHVKDGETATTIWEEDSPKLFSGDVTIEEMFADIDRVMQD